MTDGSGQVTGEPRLTRIRAYPLKGAGGFDLTETLLDSFGVPGDRRWMLVRPDGQFISQRTHPRLALIQAAPWENKGADGVVEASTDLPKPMRFLLKAPGMDPFTLGVDEPMGGTSSVRVQQDRVEAVAVDSATEWVSTFLQEDCRLVFSPDHFERRVDPAFAPGHKTSFSDGYPLLLATEESLSDLNQRLPSPSSMLRFRPNLVVKGGEPWEEDRWRVLEIGGIRLELVKPCARCSVTTVDPGTGAKGKEPLKTLSGFRGWEGKAYFGQNAIHSGTGSFRVGQTVRIVEEGGSRPPLSPG